MERLYACIDLKSFYASVECIERGFDPLTTNLVVADSSRTEKTICLAVSPSLKQYGIGGRARLFEVVAKVKEINQIRKRKNHNWSFCGSSYDDNVLKKDTTKKLDFIIAPPRMAHYMDTSAKVYRTYLKYLAPEDIYVYSIDEIFCEITHYLKYNHCSATEFLTKMILDVYQTVGITATAGIGTNLFLAKVAMDVVAKHVEANEAGVRIAFLDEASYRKLIWPHQPITDIWRVGRGTAKRLARYGLCTMGDVARCSIYNEDLLYRLFGVNAELLIDHAWGYEPCTLEQIRSFQPSSKSIHSGQVLQDPYDYQKTKLVVREMADALALELVSKGAVTEQLTLTIGYDVENLTNPKISYSGEVTYDGYGRKIPKHSHGTIHLESATASSKRIMDGFVSLYDQIVQKNLLVRRIYLNAVQLDESSTSSSQEHYQQLNLFTSVEEQVRDFEQKRKMEKEEQDLQATVLKLKGKYGKNSILKGMDLESGATTMMRNRQIGGHHE